MCSARNSLPRSVRISVSPSDCYVFPTPSFSPRKFVSLCLSLWAFQLVSLWFSVLNAPLFFNVCLCALPAIRGPKLFHLLTLRHITLSDHPSFQKDSWSLSSLFFSPSHQRRPHFASPWEAICVPLKHIKWCEPLLFGFLLQFLLIRTEKKAQTVDSEICWKWKNHVFFLFLLFFCYHEIEHDACICRAQCCQHH